MNHPGTQTARPLGLVPLALCGVLCGCFGESNKPLPPLTLVASGDTAGWIAPCGCDTNQSGGLLRRGGYLEGVKRTSEVLYVDVGGAASGTSEYDRLKFEAILRGEAAMGVAAHNLGESEVRLGGEYLRKVSADLRVPFVSCNVRDKNGLLIGQAIRIVEQGQRRFAVTGVLSTSFDSSEVTIDPPLEALLTALRTIDDEYDSLVILAYLPQDELTQLAASLPEADFVIGGPTGQSILPRKQGPAWLASTTNKGKFLVSFQTPTTVAEDWDGKVVELDKSFEDEPAQQANLKQFRETLAKLDLPPSRTSFTSALSASPPVGFEVAGTESCRECHKQDCDAWHDTPHAHAWASLEKTGSHVDPFCQQCHTTGYGMPGGFETVAGSAARVEVGCESCHGPSRAHAGDPTKLTAFADQSRSQCAGCHDRENSPRFDYQEYWRQIQHGAAAAQPQTR